MTDYFSRDYKTNLPWDVVYRVLSSQSTYLIHIKLVHNFHLRTTTAQGYLSGDKGHQSKQPNWSAANSLNQLSFRGNIIFVNSPETHLLHCCVQCSSCSVVWELNFYQLQRIIYINIWGSFYLACESFSHYAWAACKQLESEMLTICQCVSFYSMHAMS